MKETSYTYDEKGRKKTQIKSDGTSISYEYDELGRQSRYSSTDIDYLYTYDKKDNILSVIDQKTMTQTTRSYDLRGNLIQEILNTGLSIQYVYDLENRCIQTILPDKSTIEYIYQNNELHQVVRNSGVFTYSQRDLEGELIEAILPHNLGKVQIERDALSRIKQFISPYYSSYFDQTAFDKTGNLTHYSFNDTLGSETLNYAYDDLDQLIAESDRFYSYDSIGNRLEKKWPSSSDQ